MKDFVKMVSWGCAFICVILLGELTGYKFFSWLVTGSVFFVTAIVAIGTWAVVFGHKIGLKTKYHEQSKSLLWTNRVIGLITFLTLIHFEYNITAVVYFINWILGVSLRYYIRTKHQNP